MDSGKKATARVKTPEKIEECTACPSFKGYMTDLVCHTTSVDNAIKILKCGSLLSPVRARNMSAKALMQEASYLRKKEKILKMPFRIIGEIGLFL